MDPRLLFLIISLPILSITMVLCTLVHMNMLGFRVANGEGGLHAHINSRRYRPRNYQTIPRTDLEAADNDNYAPERGREREREQSRIPRRPVPRLGQRYVDWDPEAGVLGVTTASHPRRTEQGHVEEEERSPSPYDLEEALRRGGSQPTDIPTKPNSLREGWNGLVAQLITVYQQLRNRRPSVVDEE
ncbi:hypothetical protein BGW36DRAFT_68548 [Talaromyces proteolyticus]|uniref:Uncharacterized protein n=1 Tax=Talaromyces proteolyticus TaxID=1131652 RepID=A0AAD4PS12_9EURO|nr:uncharacterized protein BGW36DRAFT_68548 [Talaromyces proteolyticus]KAH8690205.1 hypothetical protein BGW36DRAFT_68548 [Talaromyces proteolyticus]